MRGEPYRVERPSAPRCPAQRAPPEALSRICRGQSADTDRLTVLDGDLRPDVLVPSRPRDPSGCRARRRTSARQQRALQRVRELAEVATSTVRRESGCGKDGISAKGAVGCAGNQSNGTSSLPSPRPRLGRSIAPSERCRTLTSRTTSRYFDFQRGHSMVKRGSMSCFSLQFCEALIPVSRPSAGVRTLFRCRSSRFGGLGGSRLPRGLAADEHGFARFLANLEPA